MNSRVFVGFLALGAVAGCNQLLGIDEASVDARLTAAGRAATLPGAGSGQGGSGAQAGSGSSLGGSLAVGAMGGTGGGEHPLGEAGSSADDHGDAGTSSGPSGKGGSTGGVTTGSSSGGSAGSKGGSSGKGSSGEGGDSSGPSDPCDDYCDIMDAECQGNDAQYRDRDQCLRICQLLPPGDSGGKDENSVNCRLKYAKKTHYTEGSEVSVYCREAGPGGDGKCGSVCEGFCSLMKNVCTADSAGEWHFDSDADCLATCNALPAASVPYSSSDPQVSDGNHALCRLFHVSSAAMVDTDEHCEHAMGHTLCQAATP